MSNFLKIKKGFVAILSVIIVMIFLIIFLTSMQLISTSNLDNSLAIRFGLESKILAESCFGDTLIQIRRNPDYSGGELQISDGYCIINRIDVEDGKQKITIDAQIIDTYFTGIEAIIEVLEIEDTKKIVVHEKKIL